MDGGEGHLGPTLGGTLIPVLQNGHFPPSLHFEMGLFWKDVPDQPLTWAMNLFAEPHP